jgi:hypothetical protein
MQSDRPLDAGFSALLGAPAESQDSVGRVGARPPRRRRSKELGSGTLSEDLAELLAEGFWGLVLLATHLDEALHAGLELIVVGAWRAAFEVELQLQHLGVAELPIEVAV